MISMMMVRITEWWGEGGRDVDGNVKKPTWITCTIIHINFVRKIHVLEIFMQQCICSYQCVPCIIVILVKNFSRKTFLSLLHETKIF